MNIDINKLEKLINEGFKINEISQKINLSISTIKRLMYKNKLISLSKEKKKEKKTTTTICQFCKQEFTYLKYNRIRKFCSKECSLQVNKKIIENNRVEINDKISNKLRKIEKKGICLWCKKEFNKRNKNHNCCSRSCSSKEINNRPLQKERISEMFSKLSKERYKRGDNSIGWRSRKKLEPSYPEKITMKYLDSKNIKYEYELKCGIYFIDFAFEDKKIALEIDGRRHDDLEIKEKDNRKDIFLSKNGWIIFRLKWKNDNKHYDKLDSFIVQFGIE
jgi:hypothetical protein